MPEPMLVSVARHPTIVSFRRLLTAIAGLTVALEMVWVLQAKRMHDDAPAGASRVDSPPPSPVPPPTTAPVVAGEPSPTVEAAAPARPQPTAKPPRARARHDAPGCPEGATCRRIDQLPSVVRGNTKRSGSARIERYACSPELRPTGPEIWYRVDLPSDGRITAELTEAPGDGVDVDLYLLEFPRPDTCIVRHDDRVAAELDAGAVWIVVDTWTTRGGRSLPGLYELTVTFTPSGSRPEPSTP